ncbi:MAG TPA: LacI family DNA-binding transcriptional regulator [Bacillota bacterium]|nr:LacI family DNA-binding transcriptional regulator [Bacillota bacterium]
MAGGTRRPTQRDVAELAGVSMATVSHVVSGRRDRRNPTSPDVAERVRSAMAELGYRPHRAGRVLQSRRTRLIAVAAYTPLNPWALTAIAQIEEVADRHGLGVVIVRYGSEAATTDRAEELLNDGIADATAVLYGPAFGEERARRLGASGLPTLVFGLPRPAPGVDVLVQHEERAIGDAARYLVETGSDRLAFISRSGPTLPDQRGDAFVTAARGAGLPTDRVTLVRSPQDQYATDVRVLQRAVELLRLPRRTRPDAIMVPSDRGAINVMWAAIQEGLRVPDDVRIIGAGNIDQCLQVSPHLTTVGCVDVDYRPAIERLIQRIGRPDRDNRAIEVPWELIIRGTT